jgi:peptide chain release factor 1
LRARVLDHEERQKQEEMSKERRSQVGSAERAEKIRTYNYPQNRITDHRVGLTLHKLTFIMEGDLDELIDAVAADERARQLEEAVA